MKRKKYDRSVGRCFATLLAGFFGLLGMRCEATENGNNAYPVGLNSLVTGVQPPPGFNYYNYTTYYTADRSNNTDGRSVVPKFNVDSEVSANRLVYTFSDTFDGLTPGIEAVIPVAHIDLTTPAGRTETTGLGDMNFGALVARHYRTFNDYVELKVFVPTGSYQSDRAANAGRNYYSAAAFYAFTYTPIPNFDVGSFLSYNVNRKNPATNYQSGQEFTGEFSANWQMVSRVYLGLGGYYYKQLTDDLRDDKVYLDGHRGMAFAIGPQIRVPVGRGGFGFKYQDEISAENRTQGKRYWLQFYYPFGNF